MLMEASTPGAMMAFVRQRGLELNLADDIR